MIRRYHRSIVDADAEVDADADADADVVDGGLSVFQVVERLRAHQRLSLIVLVRCQCSQVGTTLTTSNVGDASLKNSPLVDDASLAITCFMHFSQIAATPVMHHFYSPIFFYETNFSYIL